MQAFGKSDETAIAIGVRRRGKLRQRVGHAFGVLRQIKHRSVLEETTPLGVEPHQLKLFFKLATSLGKDALQHARQGQDGWSHVEAKALRFEDGRFAAEP